MVLDPQRLGEQLLMQRRRHGWTQQQLAALAGVHQVTVARIERAQLPHVSVDVLVRVADALGASLDVLTGRTEESELEPAEVALVGA